MLECEICCELLSLLNMADMVFSYAEGYGMSSAESIWHVGM